MKTEWQSWPAAAQYASLGGILKQSSGNQCHNIIWLNHIYRSRGYVKCKLIWILETDQVDLSLFCLYVVFSSFRQSSSNVYGLLFKHLCYPIVALRPHIREIKANICHPEVVLSLQCSLGDPWEGFLGGSCVSRKFLLYKN